jgi:hypothetical protein
MLKSYFEGGNSADVNQAYLGKFVTWKLPKRKQQARFQRYNCRHGEALLLGIQVQNGELLHPFSSGEIHW